MNFILIKVLKLLFLKCPLTSSRVDIEYFLIDPHKYEQEFCLAQNIFFESSVDNKAGMAAVADVTLNRVKDTRYPNTVCEVVYQAIMKESWKTKQYPIYLDSERKYIQETNVSLAGIVMVNLMIYLSRCRELGQSTNGCMGNDAQWYTTRYLRWINSLSRNLCKVRMAKKDIGMTLVGRIGSHIFYRWN